MRQDNDSVVVRCLLHPVQYLYQRVARLFYGKHLGKRFPFVTKLNSFLRSQVVDGLTAQPITVMGHRMYVDRKDSLSLAIFGIYEPETTQLLEANLRPGDVVIDVGANIGWFTLLAARCVGDQGKVYAFEPDPSNFEILSKNVALNGYKNVVPEQKAVSSSAGWVDLFLDEANLGGHSTIPNENSKKLVRVESIRLDDYPPIIGREINLIKMDVEGGEGNVLRGMPNLVGRNQRLSIITEFTPHSLAQSGYPPSEFLQTLTDFGFSIYEIGVAEVIEPSTFLASFSAERTHVNLWCVKEVGMGKH